jgi:hypothetical protein
MTTGRAVSVAADRLVQALATWSPRAFFARASAFLWPLGWSLPDRIVRLLWIPFWLASDLPGPRLHRRFAVAPNLGPASRRLVTLLAGVRRRQLAVRFAILVVRAIALTVFIAAGWAASAASGGRRVDGGIVIAIGLALILTALFFGIRYRPDLRDTAAMLDRSFSLSDRITTAADHLSVHSDPARSKPHLAYLQIAEATNTVAILYKHPALRVRPPVREIVLVAAAALLFLSLYLLRGTGSGLPATGNPAVPAFVSAQERIQQQPVQPNPPDTEVANAPSIEEVQQRADESASAVEDLLTLADALDDNPLTSPVANSIRSGDYATAAAQLDAVAPQVSQLSPEIRDALADQLQQAADAMTGEHPGLQDATDDAADGLRSDPQTAESSLSDLSEQIEATGKTVESQQDLAIAMRDARQSGQSGSGRDTRPEPGDAAPESAQDEQQIAGDGGDAASGQDEQSAQGQQTDGSSGSEGPGDQSGSGDGQSAENAGGQAPGQSGGLSQSGDGEPQSGDGSGQAAGGDIQGVSHQQSGQSDGSSDRPRSGSGAGAGTGQDGEEQSSNGSENKPGTGDPDLPDPNVITGDGSGSGASGEDMSLPHSTITLSRSPTESGLQSGGASSSSAGSGSGAAAGPGSVEQGDVGSAGPDSNRVPKRYREIVADYFSDEP